MELGSIMAMVGIGVMVGLAGVGSAIGTAIGGSAVVGTLKKKPESFGVAMALAAMPATQGLYGFVGFIMYQQKMAGMETISPAVGAVVLGAGLALGIVALFSAMHQGKVVANGIAAIGGGHNVFAQTLILGAFPEFYAILALVVAILMQQLIA
jgi:V/A-type H+/Na+-transporting ATPase subunit K